MADLVSVVIPVYNTNEKFKACFESVLKQKYTNIEVILVDDGSSDASSEICDIIAQSTDSFPVFAVHKTNGGVSRARNLGIDFAGGKYLVFIDSDDIVTPDYISNFMDAREKYPDVGHIWCGFEWVSHDKTKYLYSEKEQISFVDRDDYFYLFDKVLSQSPCLRMYNTSVLRDKSIRMDESLSLAEDVIFNLEYLDAVSSKSICVINSPNYLYINSDANSLNFKYRSDLLDIYDEFLLRLRYFMTKWDLTDKESITKYSNIVFLKYTEVMDNTFNRKNITTYFNRIKYNNTVLQKDEFIKALSFMNISINSVLRKAYLSKNYIFVRLYNRLISIYRWFKY